MTDLSSSSTERSSGSVFIGWLIFPFSLFPLVALLTYDWRAIPALASPHVPSANWIGGLGDGFAYYGYLLFGLAIWTVPVFCVIAGIRRILGRPLRPFARQLWLLATLFAAACLAQVAQTHAPGIAALLERLNLANAGGALGYLMITRFLSPLLSDFGASVIMVIALVASAIASIGLKEIGAGFVALFRWATAGSRPPELPADGEGGDAAFIAEQAEYAAALKAKEDAKAQRLAEKEAIRAEKQRRKEEKIAAKEAAKRAKEEAKQRLLAEKRGETIAGQDAGNVLAALNAARAAAQGGAAGTMQTPSLFDPPAPVGAAPRAAREGMRQETRDASGQGAPVGAAPRAAREVARQETRDASGQSNNPTIQQSNNSPSPAPEPPPVDKGPYVLPPMSVLAPLKTSAADHSDVEEMKQRLIDTLKIFGVDAKMAYDVQGPVVTKYAIELAPGTLYTKVTGLTANLKGALHAKSLRIEAPIPGEEYVGIEVPNRAPAGISFREIFESDAWKNSKAELPLLFGKRADGKELVADLASMPHMLVAGATGQGKSVCLNSLICGLLMTRTPEQLKLIMVDPKCVEFTPYATIPHLLVPVITDNRKVVYSLHWAVAEMEKRLKLFARARVRNIFDFNHRPSVTQTDMFGADQALGSDMPKTVPYIVVIIDEAADLIGQCGKEVNPDIQRITQKARAAGIHLILATQRPDAKIITGAIKANIPGRVAFKTSSGTDSRTILDEGGAENLIGKGDMLFRGKDGLLIRAQGAWISDQEIANVTGFIAEHADTQFDANFATKLGRVKEASIDDPFASNEDDPDNQPQADTSAAEAREQVKAEENASDFKKAVECIINTNRASTSHFQRKLGWGYNHSAKIMDMLEEAGIIGPQSGAGPRPIIMDQQQLMAVFNGGASAVVEATGEAAGMPPRQDDAAQPAADSNAGEGLFVNTEEQS